MWVIRIIISLLIWLSCFSAMSNTYVVCYQSCVLVWFLLLLLCVYWRWRTFLYTVPCNLIKFSMKDNWSFFSCAIFIEPLTFYFYVPFRITTVVVELDLHQLLVELTYRGGPAKVSLVLQFWILPITATFRFWISLYIILKFYLFIYLFFTKINSYIKVRSS